MELKNLDEYINSHIKENSIQRARFEAGFLVDKVIVYYEDSESNFDDTIVITKEFGTWYLRYKNKKGNTEVYCEIEEFSNSNEDILRLMDFVDIFAITKSEEGEIKFDTDNGDYIIVDANKKMLLGESFATEEEAKESLDLMRSGSKGTKREGKYDQAYVTTKDKNLTT